MMSVSTTDGLEVIFPEDTCVVVIHWAEHSRMIARVAYAIGVNNIIAWIRG